MKLHLRLITLLCALLLLASAWGCSMPGIGDESADNTAGTVIPGIDTDLATFEESTEPEFPTDTEEMTLPFGTEPVPETTDPHALPSLDFNGETIKILYGSDAERNEFDPDLSGDLLDDSIFARNIAIEEQLDVTLEWASQPSNASNAATFVEYALNMSNAGEPFDIYAATRRAMAKLLTSALLRDFNKIENSYIDLSAPRYPARLAEDLTIGGSVFLVTGDISANSLLQMNCIFYNVGLAENLGMIKDIAPMVSDGTWTLDALIELSNGLYVDQDGSGNKTSVDNYGFCCASYLNSDSFYSGSGLKFFEVGKTSESLAVPSDDLYSEKAFNLSEKLYGFFYDPNSYVQTPYAIEENYNLPFIEERALFCHNVLGMANTDLNKTGFEYGILPIPKYDIEQEEYITTLSNKAVFWGINLYSAKNTVSSAVIEAMAHAGYSSIAPAIFESTMKYRYSQDYSSAVEAQEIYDLMRCSISVDLGKLFSEDTSALTSTFANCVTSSASSWNITVSVASFRAQMTRGEKQLGNSLENAIAKQDK